MARSRFAISAAQSVTTCPSTHDTISSLVSSVSGATSPASALSAAAAYSRFSVAGARPHAAHRDSHQGDATRACDSMQIDMQSPRCQLPAVEGQKRRVVPESANCRENVVV